MESKKYFTPPGPTRLGAEKEALKAATKNWIFY